jgi:uncharacterized Zn finger protein (UPF0148 family)
MEERIYNCTQCEARFSTGTELIVHVRNGHDGRIFCDVCQRGYVDIVQHYRKSKLHQQKLEERVFSQTISNYYNQCK